MKVDRKTNNNRTFFAKKLLIVLLAVLCFGCNKLEKAEQPRVSICYTGSQMCFGEEDDGFAEQTLYTYALMDEKGNITSQIPFPFQVKSGFRDGYARISAPVVSVETMEGRELVPPSVYPVYAISSRKDTTLVQLTSDYFAVLSENGLSRPQKIRAKYATPFHGDYAFFDREETHSSCLEGYMFGVVHKSGKFYQFNLNGDRVSNVGYPFEDVLVYDIWYPHLNSRHSTTYYDLTRGIFPEEIGDFDEGGSCSEGLIPVKKKGKWFYIDRMGKQVLSTPEGCTFAGEFKTGLAPVKIGEKFGFIDKTGKIIITPTFTAVEESCIDKIFVEPFYRYRCFEYCEKEFCPGFSSGLAAVKLNDKWGLIDRTGNFVVKPRWDKIRSEQSGYLVEKDEKRGYVNKLGKTVLECNFDNIWVCENGYLLTQIQRTRRYYSAEGVLLFGKTFETASEFCNGLAYVHEKYNTPKIINEKGEVVREPQESWSECHGLLRYDGKIIISKELDMCGELSEGLVASRNKAGEYCYANTSGEVVIEGPFTSATAFSGGFATVSFDMESPEDDPYYDERWAIIDRTGKVVYSKDRVYLDRFSEGLAKFMDTRRSEPVYGYLNERGKVVIPATNFILDCNQHFSEGLAWEFGDVDKLINKRGEIIAELDLCDAEPYHDGIAYVLFSDSGSAYVNRRGEICVPSNLNPQPGHSDNRILIKDGKTEKYGYCDYNGNIIIKPIYDYATPYANGTASIVDSNWIVKLIDVNGKVLLGSIPWNIAHP